MSRTHDPEINHEGEMIVGSVGGGIVLGLTGAVMAWMGGHHPAMVLLSYGLIGSMGTLCVAALSGLRAARV